MKGGMIMKKVLLLVGIFFIGMTSINAVTPINSTNKMYAKYYQTGEVVNVDLPAANIARLNPANALYEFDAIQGTGANEKFFAVASREYTKYWFDHDFYNVDNAPDITFSEVTWGTTWHSEAVLVYLTDAYVRNSYGQIVKYIPTVEEGYGYYAGIAWNKIGINGISNMQREIIAESYLTGVSRTYLNNQYQVNGNFGLTYFHLPEEVVYAKGIVLVDITKDIYNKAGSASTYNGNTDGYDLDGISVYRYIPLKSESATGLGERITPKGTWFMYNEFTLGQQNEFDIQAGNPKEGSNIIGFYEVIKEDDMYKVVYTMNKVIKNGYEYDVYVKDEHLAISNTLFKSTAPGKLANQKFNTLFNGYGDNFYVFTHFEVEFR
jgi:hypothetical protein